MCTDEKTVYAYERRVDEIVRLLGTKLQPLSSSR